MPNGHLHWIHDNKAWNLTMARDAQAPVASRWMHKNDPKRRAFFVLERKGFGRIELMQEGSIRQPHAERAAGKLDTPRGHG